MSCILKCCRNPKMLVDIKQIASWSSQNIPKNGLVRFYGQPIFKRQTLCNSLKVKYFLKAPTVTVQLSSDISNKSKKVFEYLFAHKGLVLIGILSSIVTGYYVVLVSICIVLDEVIKKTVR